MSPPSLTSLTKKHRLFVEAYDGDVTSAALAAGFQGHPNYLKHKGEELLADQLILEAIKERSRYMAKQFKFIADREERQAFFTSIMRNEEPHRKEEKDANGVPIPLENYNVPLPHRLKAAELLGKSEGDFVDRIDMNMKVGMADLVMQSYTVKESIEDIEAEYWRHKEENQPALPGPQNIMGEFI